MAAARQGLLQMNDGKLTNIMTEQARVSVDLGDMDLGLLESEKLKH